MPWWGALLVGLGAALTVAEVGGLGKFLAQRVLDRTVARMPEKRRVIRAEEIQAQFEQWDRASLLRAAWAIGLWVGAFRRTAAVETAAGATGAGGVAAPGRRILVSITTPDGRTIMAEPRGNPPTYTFEIQAGRSTQEPPHA